VADFAMDRKFLDAYACGKATGSWRGSDPIWRTYVAAWAAQHASRLPGDFVECGVNRGGTCLAIMEYQDFNSLGKRFYLLDTFCGFPDELVDSANALEPAQFTECYDEVLRTFSKFPRAVIIRGKVPDTLPHVESDQIAFLSIDMNHPVPEIAALRFFWPRLVPGAIILLDDYAYSEMYRSQKQAFDELAKELDFCILSLPTGQGMIIKGS
jgi:O-methyltransferase